MNKANVISVNPGIKTMGELNIEEINLSRISRTLSNPGQVSSTFKNILNTTFGIDSNVTTHWSAKLAAIRIIAGLILLSTGILALTGGQLGLAQHAMSIISIILGISLMIGFLSRIISAGAMIAGIVVMAECLSAGVLDPASATVAVSGAVMGILGPGHYSVDQILRRGIFKLYRNRHRNDPERDPSKIAFDYSAFASVDFRIR